MDTVNDVDDKVDDYLFKSGQINLLVECFELLN
jgi:hypothetical protein